MTVLHELENGPQPRTMKEAEQRAYEKWAIGEILYRLTDHPDEDPADLLFWFKTEMYGYSDIFEHKEINPFLIAVDVTDTILATFECPEE